MNYKKLIKDIQTGKLDTTGITLNIDNDDGFWQVACDVDDDKALKKAESIEKRLTRRYGKPEGYTDIVDILQAAGVPAEWV